MTKGWAMIFAVDRDEEDWEDRRHQINITEPVEIHTLCWLCDQLEASWGYEFVTFTLTRTTEPCTAEMPEGGGGAARTGSGSVHPARTTTQTRCRGASGTTHHHDLPART